MSDLPWSWSPFTRCRARREHRRGEWFWGRCELKAGHGGDHALERGFYTCRWSTDWTAL